MKTETPINQPVPVKATRPPQNDRLSKYLHGAVFLCDKDGNALNEAVDFFTIEADKSLEGQYSSPFENSNPEQRLPTLLGMMQSGDWLGTVGIALNAAGIKMDTDLEGKLNSFEGKSNFTKINSTQIYISSQPVKINVTAYFQAWSSALQEVENKIRLLEIYSSPISLSNKSIVGNFISDLASGNIGGLFPSEAPPFVGVQVANKTYLPMRLESISAPLITPMDDQGNRLSVEVQMSFLSRTAWDQQDINNLYNLTF